MNNKVRQLAISNISKNIEMSLGDYGEYTSHQTSIEVQYGTALLFVSTSAAVLLDSFATLTECPRYNREGSHNDFPSKKVLKNLDWHTMNDAMYTFLNAFGEYILNGKYALGNDGQHFVALFKRGFCTGHESDIENALDVVAFYNENVS